MVSLSLFEILFPLGYLLCYPYTISTILLMLFRTALFTFVLCCVQSILPCIKRSFLVLYTIYTTVLAGGDSRELRRNALPVFPIDVEEPIIIDEPIIPLAPSYDEPIIQAGYDSNEPIIIDEPSVYGVQPPINEPIAEVLSAPAYPGYGSLPVTEPIAEVLSAPAYPGYGSYPINEPIAEVLPIPAYPAPINEPIAEVLPIPAPPITEPVAEVITQHGYAPTVLPYAGSAPIVEPILETKVPCPTDTIVIPYAGSAPPLALPIPIAEPVADVLAPHPGGYGSSEPIVPILPPIVEDFSAGLPISPAGYGEIPMLAVLPPIVEDFAADAPFVPIALEEPIVPIKRKCRRRIRGSGYGGEPVVPEPIVRPFEEELPYVPVYGK
jgi:hypothetical protein